MLQPMKCVCPQCVGPTGKKQGISFYLQQIDPLFAVSVDYIHKWHYLGCKSGAIFPFSKPFCNLAATVLFNQHSLALCVNSI